MECSQVADKLYEYIYGELNEDNAAIIKDHLNSCSKCMNEYMELKKLLIDQMEPLKKLKNSIEVPEDLSFKVRSRLKYKFKFNFSKYALAACIIFSLIFASPVLAYYIIDFTPLERYIELDRGIIVDFEEGRGQLIEKSSTMQGITLTVDGIIPKKDRTSILFTVKVPKGDGINYGMPAEGLGAITVTDQFGTKYRFQGGSLTLKSVNEDGEARCIYDMEPLKFWSYKLNIRVTAIELGFYDEISYGKKVKNAYGNWNVSFYIDR